MVVHDQRSISQKTRLEPAILLGIGLVIFSLTGCSSFSNRIDANSSRTGAPPYADDPEANGNPAKAWYN